MERYHIFKLGLAILFYAAYCIRPMVVNGQRIDDVQQNNQTKKFAEEDLVFYQGVEGKPGVDFPVLAFIPRTTFNCRNVDSGYYADLETDCQVFHICEDNKKISFLCPNGTIFQQSELICEWWFKVNCTNSPDLYEESAEQLREDNARRKLSRRVQNHGAVMRTEERSSSRIKASKRVFTENKLDNHATTYRDFEQNNDLSRSSSSDFVRDRSGNKQNGNEESNQRGRKPIQFQQQPSVNNEDGNEERKPFKASRRVLGRKPVNANDRQQTNGFRQQSSVSTVRTDERKQVTTNYNSFNDRKEKSFGFSESTTTSYNFNSNGFQQQTKNHARNQDKPVSTNSNSFQQPAFNNQNFGSNVEAQEPISNGNFQQTTDNEDTNNKNRDLESNVEHKPVSSNSNGFQQPAFNAEAQKPVSNDNFRRTTRPNNGFQRESFSIRNNGFNSKKPVSSGFINEFREENSNSESSGTNLNQQSSVNSYNNGFNSNSDEKKPVADSVQNDRFGEDQRPQNNFNSNSQSDIRFDSNTKQQKPVTTGTSYQQQNAFNSKKPVSNDFQKENSNSQNRGSNFNQQPSSFNRYNHGFNSNSEEQKPVSDSVQNDRFGEDQRPQNNFNSNSQSDINRFDSNTKQQKPVSTGTNYQQQNAFSNVNKTESGFNSKKTVPNGFINDFQKENSNSQNSGSNFNQQKSSFSSYNHEFSSNSEVQKPVSDSVQNDRFGENQRPQNNFNSNAQSGNNNKFVSTGTNYQQQKAFNNENKTENINDQQSTTKKFTQINQQDSTTQKAVPLSTNTNIGVSQKSTISPFSTTSHKESKHGTVKQKSTVPLTRNDIVNRRLEPSDSDEAQITQETASFYKNSFNKIEAGYKSTSPNPYPNHRETYSDLKEPKYYSTKIYSAISSVTPQYLTTQPINNGRPFIGSQVGTTLRNFSSTTVAPTTAGLFNGNTDPVVPTELFNVGRTDKSLSPIALSTLSFSAKPSPTVAVPLPGSFNVGTTRPRTESSTGRVIDHATVYGKFVTGSTEKSPAPFSLPTGTTSTDKKTISLSKSLFSGNSQSTPRTAKTSAEILSTSDSYNRGTPQVRFFGKVQATTKIPGVELNFNGNSKSSPASFNSFSTTAKPFSKTPVRFSSTIVPNTTPSTVNSANPLSTASAEFSSVAPTGTTNPEFNSVTPTFSTLGTTFHPPFNSVSSRRPFGTRTPLPKSSGFFVTKNSDSETTQKSLLSDIVRPRPFQLPPEPDFGGKAVFASTTASTPAPTYPTYKISSASPFSEPSTPEPTQPTPFTSTLPSTFENVDSMINALAEMATHNNFSDGPRPGLVIPPSAGPQTLHTLAVYFANALDGIASDKEEEGEEEEDDETLTKVELEKKRLTELLTQMTMNRYNELFTEEKEETTTIIASRSKEDDLEGQHSKGPAQGSPKVRQLAKVFTQALSSYLDDPVTFKKVLEEVRPTEPPALDNEESTDFADDELLNFSDADSKSSYPPFFPTPQSARPTWGYLLAYNTSNLDVKNSINPDLENLQGADSQSFVSQFNKLQLTTKSPLQLPEDHWTSSPDVNKLWKSAFSFNPASINENFGTTEATTTITEENTEVPEHHEIHYELKALPQLELNSTQVHGILIDFMNSTKTDDNRLQRILKKLNTTESEFLDKMKEIESNPLTRRLILLLISECGTNADSKSTEILETSSSAGFGGRQSKALEIVDSNDSQDARALQLLNSLYSIASRFGK